MEKTSKSILALFSVCSAILCSCGSSKENVPLSSYGSSLEIAGSSAKILQLTDIHWSLSTDVTLEKRFIGKIVEEAAPDFIMITGDSFFIANQSLVNSFFSFFEEMKIPYGILWGNHDFEGTYSREWLTRKAAEGQYSYFKNPSDNVTGDSNYYVDLTKGNVPFFRLYSLDSLSSAVNNMTGTYDYIHEDEVNWFIDEAEKGKTDNGGAYLSSLAFFHIPLWEWAYAMKNTPVIGEIKEKASNNTISGLASYGSLPFWPGYKDSSFFSKGKDRGVKGFFCGHDHSNNWVTTYEGAYIGYGLKTGRGCYYTKTSEGFDMTGGSLITVETSGDISIKQIFVDTDTLATTTKEGTK